MKRKPYNPSDHRFAAKVISRHDLTVWDAVCYAIDEWFLDIAVNAPTGWSNLWGSWERKTRDSEYSPVLVDEIREFFMEVIVPKYNDIIKPHVYKEVGFLIDSGIWPDFRNDIYGPYEEYRFEMSSEIVESVKNLIQLEIDWLPKNGGDGGDDDSTPEYDPVDEAKRILNI